jgi:hypothetical protein
MGIEIEIEGIGTEIEIEGKIGTEEEIDRN